MKVSPKSWPRIHRAPGQDDGREGEDDPGQIAGEDVHLLDQRGRQLFDGGQPGPEMRPISDCAPVADDDAVCRATGDHGAGIGHRPAVAQQGARRVRYRPGRSACAPAATRPSGSPPRSTDRMPVTRRRSAGTLSPGSSWTMSPRTSSSAAIFSRRVCPSRINGRARRQHARAAPPAPAFGLATYLEGADQRVGDNHGQNDHGIDVVAEQRR